MRIIGLTVLSSMIINTYAAIPIPNTNNTSAQSDNFGTQVQQNTSQAQQVFQNVNYKKLSNNEDQQDFFDDNASTADISELAKQFKLSPPEN